VFEPMHDRSTRLFSEDLQHGQRIEALVVENPFQA
jgi:predicted nucleic acid-binding protein